ncbi:MAG: hypothetical protein LUF87_02605 [Alistipes sp.]|nr:hypothetical protein [Alistipes sp.]
MGSRKGIILGVVIVLWAVGTGRVYGAQAVESPPWFAGFISQVEERTGFSIAYSAEDIQITGNTYPQTDGLGAVEALRMVLEESKYRILVSGKHVIIRRKQPGTSDPDAKPHTDYGTTADGRVGASGISHRSVPATNPGSGSTGIPGFGNSGQHPAGSDNAAGSVSSVLHPSVVFEDYGTAGSAPETIYPEKGQADPHNPIPVPVESGPEKKSAPADGTTSDDQRLLIIRDRKIVDTVSYREVKRRQ